MLKQFWSVICSFVILSGCYIPEEVPESRMKGYVGFSYPVVGGHVRIWEIHPIDGSLVHSDPIAEAITDENGEFEVDMTGPGRTLLITVQDGEVQEYWAEDPVRLPNIIHLTAIVPAWSADSKKVTVTPWTTLADALSNQQNRHGNNDRIYVELAIDTNSAMYEHIVDEGIDDRVTTRIRDYSLTSLSPVNPADLGQALSEYSPGDPEILATVSLLSLSALSRSRCTDYYNISDRNCETRLLVKDLLEDAYDDGFLNGLNRVNTTADTIRSELVVHSVKTYWELEENETTLTAEDLAYYFCELINNHDQLLFGPGDDTKSLPACAE